LKLLKKLLKLLKKLGK
nr:antimicrobial peptide {immobilized peptige E16KGL} [synthetic, Peptide Synthetic, 16 aa] [synthetic construct]